MKKISVVIPMYYEEKVAEECYRRTKEVLIKIENYEHEIIFINDWSKDNTLSILKEIANNDKKVKGISFSRNFGQQSAVTAGLKYVASDGIIGFLSKPLKFIGGLGSITILVSFVILIYSILAIALKWNSLPLWWWTLMFAITFIGGCDFTFNVVNWRIYYSNIWWEQR